MARPQTIQIFLPSGDPRGVRMAEITTRIVRIFDVPRSLLDDFLKTPEAQQVGVYFLVGQVDDSDEPHLYVGQSGGVGGRLQQQNQSKDFWTRALVAVSLTNTLTTTHATFLEWYCIGEAKRAGRYVLENGTAGSKPHTPAPLEADCLEVYDTIRVLVATLGHPVFEPLAKPASEVADRELFYCTAVGTNAKGEYTSEGFVVLKDSIGRLANVPSIVGTADERYRQRLIAAGVMMPDGDKVVFAKDHLFNSPSMAAVAVLGRTANGWNTWKTIDGKTLGELKRPPAEEPN